MTKLGCSVDSCGYNQDNLCCRRDIVVGGCQATNKYDTMCESYKDCNHCMNSSKEPNTSLNINCDAVKCIHNDNHCCNAEHITISGSSANNSTQTLCSSFLAK